MKTIATKKGGLGALYLFCFVIGVALFPTGIFVVKESVIMGLMLFACSLVLVAISLWIVVSWLKMPKDILTLEGEQFKLYNGESFTASEITEVRYRRAHAKGVLYRWGTLFLGVRGKTYKLCYIAEVEEVACTLNNARAAAGATA